jgi:hypothetical protein
VTVADVFVKAMSGATSTGLGPNLTMVATLLKDKKSGEPKIFYDKYASEWYFRYIALSFHDQQRLLHEIQFSPKQRTNEKYSEGGLNEDNYEQCYAILPQRIEADLFYSEGNNDIPRLGSFQRGYWVIPRPFHPDHPDGSVIFGTGLDQRNLEWFTQTGKILWPVDVSNPPNFSPSPSYKMFDRYEWPVSGQENTNTRWQILKSLRPEW